MHGEARGGLLLFPVGPGNCAALAGRDREPGAVGAEEAGDVEDLANVVGRVGESSNQRLADGKGFAADGDGPVQVGGRQALEGVEEQHVELALRQLLDQQVVEEKVEKLLRQQMALTSRNGKLGALVERAENSGLTTESNETPEIEPLAYEKRADASSGGVKAIEKLMGLNSASVSATTRPTPLAHAAERRYSTGLV